VIVLLFIVFRAALAPLVTLLAVLLGRWNCWPCRLSRPAAEQRAA
jgi:hypothetical protein